MAWKNNSMTETIPFADWQKLDLRVGKILEAEDIPGADKLYKLTVDLGKVIGIRTLVAGIKPYYKKEKLKDKICTIFTNLEPRTIKGILSHGMLLAAVNADETEVKIMQPDSKDPELGSKVR